MFHVEEEIVSQPALWARAADLASTAPLPRHGEQIAVVGCGTSWFMAQSYAALREGAGLGRTDAFAASEMPPRAGYDRVVLLTRSGTTSEVLDVGRRLSGSVPTLAITADPDSPVNEVADDTVLLDFADERSVVQTRFATTALVLLRSHLGESMAAACEDAAAALALDLPHDVTSAEQFTFLGRGWTVGLAHEAALKLREAAQVWSESYPAMEYRHGPISIAASRRSVWMFGDAPDGLADDVRRTGASLTTSRRDPLADLVLAQRVAVSLAKDRGLDPDHPRNLTRSVILEAT